MEDIIIRTAITEDLPTLYAFEQGIILAERPYDPTLKEDPISYYDIKAMIGSEDTQVLVAVIADELIGSAYIRIAKAKPYLNHDTYGYLGFMYVKTEYRGMGINKMILDEAINWAHKNKLNELRLDVYDENFSAIRAYEKVGFKKHLINMRLGL